MKNIYFPEQEVTFNDLYFVCYMIERSARALKRHNRYVVEHLGKTGIERQLSIAETNHCLNPDEVVSRWVNEYNLQPGNVDVTNIDSRYTDFVPSETQMGKVYARLTNNVASDGNLSDALLHVYTSPICDIIDNYNTSAFYEPSYVQFQAYQNGHF